MPERIWHGLAILIAALIALTAPFHSDPFSIHGRIIDWYAQQLRAGNGLVFNPGQPVLLIPSPAYMLLRAFSEDYILFIITVAIGAHSLFRIARRLELSPALASAASVLYALNWPSMMGFNTAFPLAGALCLVALDLGLSNLWGLAGLIAALATLCRPEALILALPLLILAVNRNFGWRYGLVLVIPLVAAVLVLQVYYGPSLLDGLLALKPNTSAGFLLGILIATSLILLFLAAWGWYKRRSDSVVALCGVWLALYLCVVVGLQRTSDESPYALIAGPLALLAVVGLHQLRDRLRLVLVLMLWVSVILAFMSAGTYDPFGPGAYQFKEYKSISGMTPGEILLLRTSPDQLLITFDGQLQPDLKLMIERGDIQSALIKYAPEILFTDESGSIRPDRLTSGPWARLDYRPLGENMFGVYRRNVPIGEFVDRQASATYGTDIQLVGMALDQSTLTPGQLVRVRLDWKFARPASKPVTIDVWLVSGDYVHARTTDEFAARVFETEWSTYHTLKLANDAWPGPVTVMVGVIVSDGVIARVPVTTLDVVVP